MNPLSYPAKRLLSAIEASPGLSRSKLASLLYPEQNPYHSIPRVSRIVQTLLGRGLVELDTPSGEERAGVQGVYRVAQKRPQKPGYMGIFGWVDKS